MIKVSVIVPVYNTEKYLEKCLNSILEEKVSKEVIIINDGSSDGSLDIIRQYMKKYKEIVLIDQENHGQGYARNAGIKKAKGEFICFVDSDDWISKGSIDDAVKKATEKNLDILYWQIHWVYENGNIKNQPIHSMIYQNHDNIGYLLSDPSPCNKLIRRKIFQDNHLEFPTDCIYEDFAFIPSLVKYTEKIEFCEDIVYNYYQRESSTMNQIAFNPKVMDLITSYNHLYTSLKPLYKDELEYLAINQLIYFRTFELLKYSKKEKILEVLDYVNGLFPHWKNNKYYKKRSKFIQLYCFFIRSKCFTFAKLLYKIRLYIRK